MHLTELMLRTLRRSTGDQRGVVLPMALLTLLLLTALAIAFTTLVQSEPVISSNHLRTSRARALAESGVERAVWALGNAGITGAVASIPSSGVTAASPYDGSSFQTVQTGFGGFFLTIVGSSSTQATITSVGWTPSPMASDTKATQRVTVTLMKLMDLAVNAPCALCVNGPLRLEGSSVVDATGDTSCGDKWGATSRGDLTLQGNAKVYGAKYQSSVENQYNASDPSQSDYVKNDTTGLVDYNAFKLTSDDMDALKAVARSQGTYYGPLFGSESGCSATVCFGSSNPPPNGIVFVDSLDGSNTLTSSNLSTVKITGTSGTFKGWIIVNGTLTIDGNVNIDGMVYAGNDVIYRGTGTGQISGLAIAQNAVTGQSGIIDSDTEGNATVRFNCANARSGGGQLPTGWFVKPGSYREG